jgi:hypothetical protein
MKPVYLLVMMRPLKAIALTIVGVLVASSCLAQERQQRPFHFPDENRKRAQERQDNMHRRLEAGNSRAQRSICEDFCKVKGRPQRTQPADPFAELPSWEVLPDQQLSPIDEQGN